MRGRMLVNLSPAEYTGGEYTFDGAFNKAPAAIRKYAQQLWKKYREEKMAVIMGYEASKILANC